jgi:hypothetical protein
LPAGDIRVGRDELGYYLSASAIDNPPAGKTFYEAAQDLLPLVNALGRLKSSDFRPVSLMGKYDNEHERHTVALAGTAEVRSRAHGTIVVTGPDGTEKPSLPPSGARGH